MITCEAYDTSSAQKRLYLINQLYGDSTLYNMTCGWIIEGHLEPLQLEGAIKKMIRRHETLRTSFSEKDGEVLQKVHKHLEFQLKYQQIEENSTKNINAIFDDFIQPFDLANVPLWRTELVQLQPDKQLLLFDIHHIISDGVSMGMVINDLMTFYTGSELPELEYQYVDFTLWQNDQWQSDRIKRQEQYWLKVFAGELPVCEMPVDYPRSLTPDFTGDTIEFVMNSDLTSKIKKLALKNNTTLYVVLLTLYTILLSKTTGQEDIVVGTPVSGRTHRQFESIIGMFVNTLAMRNQHSGDKTFNGFLQEVSRHVFSAFENQDYPFEMLVEKLVPQRHLNQNPLFNTMFALQNYSQNLEIFTPKQEKLKCAPYLLKEKTAKFDVTLVAVEKEDYIDFSLLYRTSLFRKYTMERFIRHFLKLTGDVVKNPDIKTSHLAINTEEEKEQILFDFNDTYSVYPKDKTIHELFEKQVEKTPNNIAIVGVHQLNEEKYNRSYGSYSTYLSYKELNQQANQLAYLLIENGVLADHIVGITVESSIEMIIGLLGILKANGAFLLIDPDYPQERIDYMLKDSNTKILLTGQKITDFSSPQAFKQSPKGTSSQPSNLLPFYLSNPLNLAYIIYTSGTTGKPKGVMIQHQSLVNLCSWHNRYFQVKESDHATQYAKISFDASVWEIFPYLIKGASLTIINPEIKLDIEKLNEFFETRDITISFLPTQLCEQFMELENYSLQKLLTGGDHLGKFIKRNYQLYNNYGPTEDTVVNTSFPVKQHHINIPIGQPIDNNRIYILDKNGLFPQPIGIPGELCITGDGLARGYLNNPELTAEKFQIINKSEYYRSYRSYESYILYRTGDLVRWLPDSNIEFLGRIDFQVKIRGVRIELAEIENQLLNLKQIKKTIVIDKETRDGDKYLCAYIVSDGELIPEELKKHLSDILPDYMIPSYFIPIEIVPLTSSGKIDRKALPEPEIKPTGITIAPRNRVEAKLADIWSEILNLDVHTPIGIDDNFFESGGHSLKANTLMAKIHKEFSVKIPLAQIFKTPVIKELARYITKTKETIYAAIAPVEKKSYYPVSSAQKRMFILNQLKGSETSDNTPLVVRARGKLDKNRFEKVIGKLIKRHEVFRTSFKLIDEDIPVQMVHPEVGLKIIFAEVQPGAIDHAIAGAVRPFDLSRAPLLRVGLFRLSPQEHIIMCDMHHIISDGTARAIFINEFINLYEYEAEGGELPVLQIQYKDFTCWQNQLLQSEYIKKQEEYWCNIFGDASIAPLLNMPTDFPRPKIQSFAGYSIDFQLSKNVTVKVRSFILERSVTLYMFLLAAYNILLSRWGGQEDIVAGTPIAGRPHADLGQIIGMFVNTLPMRNYPSGEKTFREFLEEVKVNALNAYENQDYQFEELVNRLGIKPDPGRHPLFDTMFVVQNIDVNTRGLKKEIKDISFRPYQFEENITQFDIITHAFEGEEDGVIGFKLRYCVKLFKQETIERFIDFFKEIITAVVDNPHIKLKEIKLSHGLFDQKLNAFEQEGDFDF